WFGRLPDRSGREFRPHLFPQFRRDRRTLSLRMHRAPLRSAENRRRRNGGPRSIRGHGQSDRQGLFLQTIGRRSPGGGRRRPVQLRPQDRNDPSAGVMSIADLRKSYTLAGLRRADLAADPIQQFHSWLQQAIGAQLLEPTAMTLATAGKTGRSSARVVLLKGLDDRGFVFYTNYESRKARELLENSNASLVFYWAELERQVRVGGTASRISRDESERYFKSRPRGHQLGAWVSTQSEVI